MRRLLLSTVLLILFMPQSPALSDCGRIFSMSHSGDYVPYQYTDEDGRMVGLDVDLIRLIMAEMTCEVAIREIPPKRAQHLLASGGLDLMAAASITPERREYAHFSVPYRDERIVMFVHRAKYPDLKDLTLTAAVDQERRIAAGVGGWYGPEYGAVMDRAVATGALTLNTSTDQRIRMLLVNRLDIVVADLLVGYHHAIEAGRVQDIIELPHVLNSDPVHFMLSRKTVSEAEVAKFDQAIATVMQSDGYRHLIEKYKPVIGVPTD